MRPMTMGAPSYFFLLLFFAPFAVFLIPEFLPSSLYARTAVHGTAETWRSLHYSLSHIHNLPPSSYLHFSLSPPFLILHLHLYNHSSSSCCTLRPQLSLRIVAVLLLYLPGCVFVKEIKFNSDRASITFTITITRPLSNQQPKPEESKTKGPDIEKVFCDKALHPLLSHIRNKQTEIASSPLRRCSSIV